MIDFDKLIDQYLYREKYQQKIGWYYPSQIGQCMRKVWLGFKEPKETEPELIKVFHSGNIIHEFITKVLESDKTPDIKLLETEIPFKVERKGFTISGRADNIFLVRAENKVFLLEVKSIKSITKHLVKPQTPHMMQIQLYMQALSVPNGIILYIDKTNLKTRAFEVSFSQAEVDKALERFDTLHESLTSGKMPGPEAIGNKEMEYMCVNCEYKDKCD